jgi:hypothetical protein
VIPFASHNGNIFRLSQAQASIFVFGAVSVGLSKFQKKLYDDDIINAAIWCLAKDERENEDLMKLRHAALVFLRLLAIAQIRVCR